MIPFGKLPWGRRQRGLPAAVSTLTPLQSYRLWPPHPHLLLTPSHQQEGHNCFQCVFHPKLHLINWADLELNTSSRAKYRFSLLAGDGAGCSPCRQREHQSHLLCFSGQMQLWFSAAHRKGNSFLLSAFSKADARTPLCPGKVFILQINIDPHAKS